MTLNPAHTCYLNDHGTYAIGEKVRLLFDDGATVTGMLVRVDSDGMAIVQDGVVRYGWWVNDLRPVGEGE